MYDNSFFCNSSSVKREGGMTLHLHPKVASFPYPLSDIAKEGMIKFQYSDFCADKRERIYVYRLKVFCFL